MAQPGARRLSSGYKHCKQTHNNSFTQEAVYRHFQFTSVNIFSDFLNPVHWLGVGEPVTRQLGAVPTNMSEKQRLIQCFTMKSTSMTMNGKNVEYDQPC